jgi:hypothetical protein
VWLGGCFLPDYFEYRPVTVCLFFKNHATGGSGKCLVAKNKFATVGFPSNVEK